MQEISHLLASKDYYKIQNILQDYELQTYSLGNESTPEFTCILAGIYCILNSIVPLRFLIKRISKTDHDCNQWSEIATLLASFQYRKLFLRISNFTWNYEINSILIQHFKVSLGESQFSRLSKVYISIEPGKASSILGIPTDLIGKSVRERNWDIDAGAGNNFNIL